VSTYGHGLIGLGGALGSGKDATADYLVEKHGWVKIGMSDILNEALSKLNPVVQPAYAQAPRYTDAIERYGYVEAKARIPEFRRLMQAFGTEVGRDMFGEDFWVDLTGERIDALRSTGQKVAVTGIRFPNELKMIAHRGGTLLWISRPNPFQGEAQRSHASESSVSMADFDAAIFNTGTLEDLYSSIDEMLADHHALAA
jgi:hypothetical protein